ncbi:MAG: hypothetical protein WBG54_22400 [Acidobacteriaceae bacterium]
MLDKQTTQLTPAHAQPLRELLDAVPGSIQSAFGDETQSARDSS